MVITAFCYDFFATFIVAISLEVISAVFFILQFKQISQEFRYVCRVKAVINRFETLVKHHNSVIVEVERFNAEMKYYLYVLIKLVKPAFNTFIYLLFDPLSEWHFQVFVGLMVVGIAVSLTVTTHLFASISHWAHKPLFFSYSLLLSRDFSDEKIPLRIRVKIMRFIERLSGRVIGIYCYDLFPLTTYEFTDYILDSMVSFLLVVKFLKRLNLV